MHKYLLFFLLLTLSLFSATPKLYKPIGDPIYKQINSVKKISDIGYFKNQKRELLAFVKRANTHKKLGFTYDKKRRNKNLSKEEQKSYLKELRDLDKELTSINRLAKDALPVLIKRRYIKSFYQLKSSKLSFLRQDSTSAWLVKKYSRELNKKERLRQQKEAKRVKNDKIAYKKKLRSYAHLNGTWTGKNSDKEMVSAFFNNDKLSLTYKTKNKTNIIKGNYHLNKKLSFRIKIRKLIEDKRAHIRHINIKRSYEVLKITEKELILQYKDEKLSLKRN